MEANISAEQNPESMVSLELSRRENGKAVMFWISLANVLARVWQVLNTQHQDTTYCKKREKEFQENTEEGGYVSFS